MPPPLPENALAALQNIKAQTLARGQIWWLPAKYVGYRGEPKGRYCLLIAVEKTPQGDVAQGHFVAGTSKEASGPALVIEKGELTLGKRTEFDFSLAWAVPAGDVAGTGNFIADLSSRIGEIDKAVSETRVTELLAVKRVLGQ
jgi:hypothetical protein